MLDGSTVWRELSDDTHICRAAEGLYALVSQSHGVSRNRVPEDELWAAATQEELHPRGAQIVGVKTPR